MLPPRFDESSWRKASSSLANGECVEIASSELGYVGIRDSKDPDGHVIFCNASSWYRFVSEIKD
jgi:Domain of unknown function (DUF397)